MKKAVGILIIIVILMGFTIYHLLQRSKDQDRVINQNELAYNSEMQRIKKDSSELFQKYALIISISEKNEQFLKERDEKILAQSNSIIELRKIISQTAGEIVFSDTGKGISYGSIIEFKNKNKFYSYTDSVHIQENPFHKLSIKFTQFDLRNYLTRNKNGEWSGYAKFYPEWVSEHITLNNLEVFVEKDEFVQIENYINKFSLSLIPQIGFVSTPEILFQVGASIMINKKHLFGYKKAVGASYQEINYGYNLDLF